jgi:hypothetical protein
MLDNAYHAIHGKHAWNPMRRLQYIGYNEYTAMHRTQYMKYNELLLNLKNAMKAVNIIQ